MFRTAKALVGSLGFRLLVGLLVVTGLVAAIYAFVILRNVEAHWIDAMSAGAMRTSELVKNATRYAMLLNRKEDVHQTLRQLAQGPQMAGIRIYDKNGRIIFSADDKEIGRGVDLQAEACVACHKPGEPLHTPRAETRTRVFKTPDGAGILGVISPIVNGPDCSSAECHAHPDTQTVLGVLDVRLSMAPMRRAFDEVRGRMILATLILLAGVMILFAVLIQRVVRRPIRHLYDGVQHVAAGDLDAHVEVRGADELSELAQAFNRMTADLKRARVELTDWSDKLEVKVVEKTEELGRAQRQMIQREKMASLGKLAATVAHELNNPLAGILTYAKLVKREVDDSTACAEGRADTLRYLDLVQKESSRCGTIVKNLLLFSRRSGVAFAPIHVNEIVDRATMLVRHHLEMASLKLEKLALAGDDVVICDADQLEQALVALLVNAVEAMQGMGGGTLTVRVVEVGNSVDIEVQDTGVGIPPDVLPHIFEPFFSTKDKESGVGLGLAVVYGIAQRHGGTVDAFSKVGAGTTFRLRLPRRPPSPAEAAQQSLPAPQRKPA